MTDLGCTYTRNEMRARSVTNTHACNQTFRHKHWIVRGLGTAAQTYRTTLMHSHTGTTNMWLPQRPLSHVEQIHTNTVMSVCSSQPQAADLFIRNSAAEGQSEHSPVFFFFPSQSLVVDKLRFRSNSRNSFVLCILWWNVWKCNNGKHNWVVPKYSCMICVILFTHQQMREQEGNSWVQSFAQTNCVSQSLSELM